MAVLLVFYAPSLLLEGESLIPSPHGPWINPGPPGWINFSTAQIIQNTLANGGNPFWSEKIGIGVPLLADPHNAYFSPFSLVLYLWPNSYGWDVSILLKVVLGLAGVYVLGRSLSLSPWIAAWTASLFMLSGHVFQFLHHFHTNSLVFMPWCLAGLVYGLADQPRRSLWLIGISLPLMILGGGLLDVVLLALFVAMVFGIFLLLPQRYPGASSVLTRSRLVVLPAIVFVLGILIAFIWILPYLELRQVSISPRSGRSTAVYNDYWYAVGLFVNQIMELPRNPSHWLMKEKQYMSVLLPPGMLLAVMALIQKSSRYQYFYLALIAYGLIHFLKLYGFGPLQFINLLPILKDVRFEKYIGLYTLGVCLVSAYGYEYFFLKNKKTKRVFTAVLGACFVVVIAILLYASHVEADN